MKRTDLTPYSDPDRDNIKAEILDLIESGNSKKVIFSRIIQEYGNKWDDLTKLYVECVKKFKDDMKLEKDFTWQRNFNRLEILLQDAADKKDVPTMLKIIDQENKLANLYNTNLHLDTENIKSFKIELN